MTWEQLKELPKIDLHCHLDGSLSLECVQELLGREITMEELQAADDCDSLKTYLEKFDLPVSVLQTENGLKKAAYDVVRSAAAEHVCYMEIRFAPLLSVHEHLSCERVIASVLEPLAGKIEGLNHVEVRRTYAGADIALYCELESKEAMAFYADHPLHTAAKEKFFHLR